MMEIETIQLGVVGYEAKDVLSFEEGLYGFTEAKQFIIIGESTPEFPFQWLQSLESSELSFVITSPFLFVDQYDFEIPEAITEKMCIKSIEDVAIYSLVVIPEVIEQTTLNLKAPLLINKSNRQGKQLILNEDYPYKYKIFGEK